MTTAYTSLLGLALPVTGELAGTWGDTVNNYITSYLDAAVAGAQTISGTQTAVTLSVTNGSSLTQVGGSGSTGSSQYQIINCTGNPAGLLTITAPAASKVYLILNSTSTSQSVKIVGTGPTTGVTVISGEKALVAWNGSDFVKVATAGGSSTFSNVTVTGTTTLSGLTASTALALDASKNVVSVTNTGTGNNVLSASPTLTGTVGAASLTLSSLTSGRVTYAGASGLLQDSANLTFDGTTLTAANITSSGTWTFSGGTANGVLYLNGSKVATSGSALTFDGTNLGVATASPQSPVDVVSNASANSIWIRGRSADGLSALRFYSNDGGTQYSSYRAISTEIRLTAFQDVPFTFYTNSVEQMRLTSTGLGIGTSSPGYKLDVNGVGRLSGGLIVSGNTASSSATSVWASSNGQYLQFNSGSSGFSWNNSNNTVGFMLLDSAGNLGLGVTPVSGAAAGTLFLKDNAQFVFSGPNSYYYTNAAFSSGNNRYVANGYATSYVSVNGQHIWSTAPSGTAGNAISFSQVMTLDASGRLEIGTTTTAASPLTIQSLDTSGYGIDIINDSTSNLSRLRFCQTGTTSSWTSIRADGRTTGYMAFYTNDTERARIDSSGRFLVGTTGDIAGGGYFGVGQFKGSYPAIVISGTEASARTWQVGENAGSLTFYDTTGGERARIDSSGNFLSGVTSSTGSASNSLYLVGGLHSTVNGTTGTATSGVAITLFTSVNDGTYIVTAQLTGSAPTSYTAVALVKAGGGTLTTTNLSTATLMTISVSGTSVQATQSSGANQNITYSAIRIA